MSVKRPSQLSSSLPKSTNPVRLLSPTSVVTGAPLSVYEPSARWNDGDPYYTRLWLAGVTSAMEDRSKCLHPQDRWLHPPDPRNVAIPRTQYDAAILLHLGRKLAVPGCQRACCQSLTPKGERAEGQ